MKRSLGVCTWTYGPVPLAQIARSLRRLSYDGVELHGDLDAFSAREAQKILSDQGLDVFSLTPGDVDIAHPDAVVRGAGVDYFRRLIDFAAELDAPIVSVHGKVGRVRALESQQAEYRLLCEGVAQLARHARACGVPLVFEVLNRYESHLINTGAQALALMAETGCEAVRPLLDAYHMNIEEADLPGAIRHVGSSLGLFHIADTNRQGLGLGHLDVAGVLTALDQVSYRGPIIVECTAAGPDPFTPVKNADYLSELENFLERTHRHISQHTQEAVYS
ncbi:sugar phosphate isomerase/epimerase [Ameyamaea chiangmaiensis NBRC 103196]|uniref:Sugar phosphate isomerase/epimerase n=1 Tax=Ameyamaea chiangmaiensis TaxID=442969 RepID=A0A850P631_9PROT|nr:sugar phosphate isomerase/epimerase family protein [Ameyamaea chiangmaiensis]MBS4075035.1 sugar phosphate isomerase/epimerase [Ameyamaea chiangmaiensis]NVN40077.1 sugar phosphate isomerase/epimerase [Ameyamaea chiangmaiensis]GBQ65700.1 sugar phosphate isomerase/epimerase [Ameyamaea chiangmaiensis NBRC 103196]